ncbi:MAG: hypothetical protein E6G47_09560, partial [Actinobacteria bacterium]
MAAVFPPAFAALAAGFLGVTFFVGICVTSPRRLALRFFVRNYSALWGDRWEMSVPRITECDVTLITVYVVTRVTSRSVDL